jgi:phage terminase large subunit-like protein
MSGSIINPADFAAKYVKLESGKPLILEPWQRERIINPLFFTLTPEGLRKYNLALIGMGKKNGKSTLAALVVAFMLLADGEPNPEIYSAAFDKDQASVIFRQVKGLIERSPALLDQVKVYRDAIELKHSEGLYRPLSAESRGRHGLNASCVVFDELWNQRSYDLWESLTHSPARKQPLHFCITYAGLNPVKGNLLYDLYQTGKAGTDPGMLFTWFEGEGTGPNSANPASWISPEYLAQQKRRLPESRYTRMHCSSWTTGESSFLTKDDVDASLDTSLSNQASGTGFAYFAGLDIGLTNDASVVTVCHRDPSTDEVILDHVRTWKGKANSPVILDEIERHLFDLGQRFNRLDKILFDPYQAVSIAQRLLEKGLPMEQFNFSANNITRLTQNLFQLFKNGRIKLFEYDPLTNELLTVKIVEKNYGFRIDHERGQHDDHVISLGLAALAAVEAPAYTLATKYAVATPYGPNNSAVKLEIQGEHHHYRYAFEEHEGQTRIRVICPVKVAEGKNIFIKKFFNDSAAFRSYLTAQHGALRFINNWSF